MSWRYKGGFIQEFFDPTQPGTPIPGLFTWGGNNLGQLGQGDIIYRSSPVQVGNDATWSTVSSMGFNVLATKSDGTLWSWGANIGGQLGIGNVVYKSSPTQVGALTTWLSTSAGLLYSAAAIKTDGTLWVWGESSFGQLGQNDRVNRSSPVQVGTGTTWSNVSALYNAMIAKKTDGTIWTWGANTFGQLGQNIAATTNRSSPVQVGALTTWSKVSGGAYFMLATKTDGTMWSWGSNSEGQLGQNIASSINRSSPVQVGALTTWLAISASNYTAMATKTDGTLWAWGSNTNGQLGQSNTTRRSSPVQVGALTSWATPNTGFYQTFAIKTDGTLWIIGGNNSAGQLGISSLVNKSSPTQVGSLATWTAISSGRWNTSGIASS